MPEAVLNYLARLGWAHGDAEVFSKEQFVSWFDLEHLGKSPAQHNPEKLLWLNHHYIQHAESSELALRVIPFAKNEGIEFDAAKPVKGPDFVSVVDLLKGRANTLIEIAQGATLFYAEAPNHALTPRDQFEEKVPQAVRPALENFIELLQKSDGTKEQVAAIFKEVLANHGLKMPALAMPVRYLMFATTQTPAIDAVIAILGISEVVGRLRSGLA